MERDELYPKAVEVAKAANPPSISNLQRYLMIGYNRASRLMDYLIEDGIVEQFETENGTGYRRKVPNV
ncbi:DNA translocase FtsK [Thiobacillus sedimenti]|uniref:DNA translocase FtsK n=1 Tax=Thiobacillus sedimenti TaxID=3110231 RepID=A0ABZ1CM44_9PROT|nr:DNA translocase FtsK [Thiobacillus sp. SCUT-2]WRS40455.1 DNA translocase FtsK [Thiobacillus sp. SCUT-2]